MKATLGNRRFIVGKTERRTGNETSQRPKPVRDDGLKPSSQSLEREGCKPMQKMISLNISYDCDWKVKEKSEIVYTWCAL
jgi:hypothetical protein